MHYSFNSLPWQQIQDNFSCVLLIASTLRPSKKKFMQKQHTEQRRRPGKEFFILSKEQKNSENKHNRQICFFVQLIIMIFSTFYQICVVMLIV